MGTREYIGECDLVVPRLLEDDSAWRARVEQAYTESFGIFYN
jgi:hypothetical protein